MNLSGIPQNHVNDVWPDVALMVADALSHGNSRVSISDVYEGMLRGLYQLWVVHDKNAIKAVVVTEIVKTAACKFCSIFIVIGEGREYWQDQIYLIEDWAKSLGCEKVVALARYGWKKILKSYKVSHIELEKEL